MNSITFQNTKKAEMSSIAAGLIITAVIIALALIIFFSKTKSFTNAIGLT